MKFRCCAVCGSTSFWGLDTECHNCGYKVEIPPDLRTDHHTTKPLYFYSRHDIEDYESISLSKYGTKEKWYDVFVEEELSHISTFNYRKYKESKEIEENYYKMQVAKGNSVDTSRKTYIKRMQKPRKETNKTQPVYTPKCPLCGSPNIKQISDIKKTTHALAFGLFSKTARSQWECKNCGNKF